MTEPVSSSPNSIPKLVPLGDRGLLVRFADKLDLAANAAAISLARTLGARTIMGVTEIVPHLVSVLVRYDPRLTSYDALAGEMRIALAAREGDGPDPVSHMVGIHYGGDEGPDLEAVAASLELDTDTFIAMHGAFPLRVLAVGFAPGFLYCGLHEHSLIVGRRESIRARVPAGSVLFAAGQTAIAATAMPTGWSVIGRTDFVNFDAGRTPPTTARAGDEIAFRAMP